MMRQVLGDGQFAVEARMLEDDSEPAAHGDRVVGEVVAQDHGASLLNRDQGRQQLEQRGLAAAVRSEEPENFAARDREGHVAQRGARAVVEAER